MDNPAQNAHNGNNPPDGLHILTLSFDPKTFDLQLGGNIQSINVMLAMLAQASRYLDIQYRINAGIQAQEEQNKRKAEFERVQSLLRK